MNNQDYQKNILIELMNIEEFITTSDKDEIIKSKPLLNKNKTSINPYDAHNINDLVLIIKEFLVRKSLRVPTGELTLV